MSTISPLSEQRRFLNEYLLDEFKSLIRPGSIILDIGKTDTFDYNSWFKEYTYISIDRDGSKNPSLVLDAEKSSLPFSAEGVIFNGVFEQCDDPFAIKRNMLSCLKPSGVVLFGLAGIGMKPYGERDKWRVTKEGALSFVKPLNLLKFYPLPEYFYALARKD